MVASNVVERVRRFPQTGHFPDRFSGHVNVVYRYVVEALFRMMLEAP